MQDRSLCARLKRYSRKCISERLDPDFADAVEEAVSIIDSMADCSIIIDPPFNWCGEEPIGEYDVL